MLYSERIDIMQSMEDKIKEINYLYHKSKKEGLTEEEKQRQTILRQEYINAVRGNLRNQLNQIDLVEKDGTIVNLGAKIQEKQRKQSE